MRVIISGPSGWKKKAERYQDSAALIKKWLCAEIDALIAKSSGQVEAASSLHLGLDTYFAALCQSKAIPLHVILSCSDQDAFWGEPEKEVFRYILDGAETTSMVVDGTYSPGCISKQSTAITDWVLQDPEPVILLVKFGPIGKTQQERITLAAQKGAAVTVKVGRFKCGKR